MLIANPIYDSVFKYLLEDTDLAREFLGTILGEEIVSIAVKPQETVAESADYGVNIFRLDFKAIIRTVLGERRKVLIELQKAKRLLDIMRFRRYLADNYQEEDSSDANEGGPRSRPLPIVTIYLLGFKLATGYPAVFKMEHQVTDVLTGAIIAPRPREPFVELLNHESYTVQIPLLTDTVRTRLEGALMVFNQEHRTDNPHVLDFTGDLSDPLVKKMVERLARAVSDPDVRRAIDAEAEVDRTITRILNEEKLKHQAEADRTITRILNEEKLKHQAEADRTIRRILDEEKLQHQMELQAVMQGKDAELQEKDRLIAELQQQLAAKDEGKDQP